LGVRSAQIGPGSADDKGMVIPRTTVRTGFNVAIGIAVGVPGAAVCVAATLGTSWQTGVVGLLGLAAVGVTALRSAGGQTNGAPAAATPRGQAPSTAVADGAHATATARIVAALAALDESTDALVSAGTQLREATEADGIQSRIVTAAAESVLADVSLASSMSEELAAAMRVIAADAAEVALVSGTAAALVESTTSLASRLGTTSVEIGSVLTVIGKIASQTNLLALNAAIEAARSGEAGKAFKVVASEVKDLSRATDQATKNIESRVLGMQADSGSVVEAIEHISAVIGQVNEAQATIAEAVGRTASSELDQCLGEAVSGAMAIAMNLGTNAESAARTSASVDDVVAGIEAVRAAARDLSAGLSPEAARR
jgi:methyl-accepting chemotaxis protein